MQEKGEILFVNDRFPTLPAGTGGVWVRDGRVRAVLSRRAVKSGLVREMRERKRLRQTLVCRSLLDDRPYFASTSSSDFRPRLRTFIISSEVRLQSSSTVLIPARFKQL